MTAYQSMMLSVCFGATVGMMLSGVVLSIKYWIEDRREKKRRAKEEKKLQKALITNETAGGRDSSLPPV